MGAQRERAFLGGILTLLLAITLFAQPPDTLWTKTYGGSSEDRGSFVQETSDGGYIIVGTATSFGDGSNDVYLVKTDEGGDTLWTKTYGGAGSDMGRSVQETSDEGYIIAALTTSFGAGGMDIYAVKTSADGESVWAKTYGDENWEWAFDICEASDGGYIICGSSSEDACLLKIDEAGDTVWVKTYGREWVDEGTAVAQTTDGGYIVAGWADIFAKDLDVYLIKTDVNGDSLWTKNYGGTDLEMSSDVQETSDGGYIIVGSTTSSGEDSYDVYLVKTDEDGETLWTKTYGGPDRDEGYSVQQTSDSGYIIAGMTTSDADDYDVWLLKTDANGDTLWTMMCGGTDNDAGAEVLQTSDGGYIIAGYTGSFGAGDVWLIKTEPVMKLRTPNGGEVLTGGETHKIHWWRENPPQGPYTYRLLLSVDGGESFPGTIAEDISYNDTSYTWRVPDIGFPNCRVKVELMDESGNPVGDDDSDADFAIELAGVNEEYNSPNLPLLLSTSLNRLSYELPGQAQLSVYSADGRKVFEESVEGKGVWKPQATLPQGVYFVRLKASGFGKTARLVILR